MEGTFVRQTFQNTFLAVLLGMIALLGIAQFLQINMNTSYIKIHGRLNITLNFQMCYIY